VVVEPVVVVVAEEPKAVPEVVKKVSKPKKEAEPTPAPVEVAAVVVL
jgi:hypothetical protein